MAKVMTPMTRLNNGLTKLKNSLIPVFKEYTLNKSSPKSYYEGGWDSKRTKGVETDFISIMQSSKGNIADVSFAFSFTFLNLPEKEHTVQVSVKRDETNESIITSPHMSVDEFKEKLNEFNREFKNCEITSTNPQHQIVKFVIKTFGVVEPELSLSAKEGKKKFFDFVEEKTNELNIAPLREEVEKAEKKLSKAYKAVEKDIKETGLREKIAQLEEQLKQSYKELENKKEEFSKTHQVTELRYHEKEAKQNLNKMESKLLREIENALKKIPPTHRDQETLVFVKEKRNKIKP